MWKHQGSLELASRGCQQQPAFWQATPRAPASELFDAGVARKAAQSSRSTLAKAEVGHLRTHCTLAAVL